MLDPNGNVATWNVGAQRIKGYSAEEIIGQHFSKFYPRDVVETGWPEHELQVAAQEGRFIDEGWRIKKSGERFWANVTITALRDEHGRLLGFAKLTRDLTERRRTEAIEKENIHREQILEAERNARIAAQQATRMKDEFLATLSHELRTPLSAILGWTQVLLRDTSGLSFDHRRAIEVIERNARAQVQLINDLLDLSQIMTGKVRLDLQQALLADIVHEAVESAKPAAAAKDIQLIAMLDPIGATVTADPSRLQQVVWNLLTNAVKFTPKGGKIQVFLQRVNSHAEISVSDTGIGIAANFLPHVFDRFVQGDSSTTRAHHGLGLGLALSKQLVELHGGSIRVASQGEGKGATFFVSLPLSIVQLRAEDVDRHHPTAEAPSSEHLVLPSLKGLRVFVIDDEPDARDFLRRLLEGHEAVVVTFESADAALTRLKQDRPDVIVSDIGMPSTDGYQFMRAWRAAEARDRRIPAMALTAFARAEDRKRSLLAGYQAHLAKPFDIGEFLLLVADLGGR
jgi:PAS domain S-box-containing protein